MKIMILALGTRGDVQPYIALGMGLQWSGYDVTIVTSTRFASMITERGLRHVPLNADFMTMMEGAEGNGSERHKPVRAAQARSPHVERIPGRKLAGGARCRSNHLRFCCRRVGSRMIRLKPHKRG
jgi:hypothetical protein